MGATANPDAETVAPVEQVGAGMDQGATIPLVTFTENSVADNTLLISARYANTAQAEEVVGGLTLINDAGEDPFHTPDPMRPKEGGVFNETTGKWEYPEVPQPELNDPPTETEETKKFDELKRAFQQVPPERQADAMEQFGPHFEKTIADADEKFEDSLRDLNDVFSRPEFQEAMRNMKRVGGDLEATINLMDQDKITDFGKSFAQNLTNLTGNAKLDALAELKDKLDNTNDPKLKAFLEGTISLMENPPATQAEKDQRIAELGGSLDKSATRELMQSMRDNPEMEGAAKMAMNQNGLNELSSKFHNFRDVEDQHASEIDNGKEAFRNYRHAYLNSMNLRGQYAEVLVPIGSQEFREKSMQYMEDANRMAEKWFGEGNVWGDPKYESFLWKRPIAPPLVMPGVDI